MAPAAARGSRRARRLRVGPAAAAAVRVACALLAGVRLECHCARTADATAFPTRSDDAAQVPGHGVDAGCEAARGGGDGGIAHPAVDFACAVYPPLTPVSAEEAEVRECCRTLPCVFSKGCWDDAMPPVYSAPRARAFSREEGRDLFENLIVPAAAALNKTMSPDVPGYGWFRVPVPRVDRYAFFYDGIRRAFRRTFGADIVAKVDLDVFYVDDFTDRWASDETYTTSAPGAAYWIHTDCENFKLCAAETGYPASAFTGNGAAFVAPIALPSERGFSDGHALMPAALELYNVSYGHRDSDGQPQKPANRQWMTVHRYNVGELIFFNAMRYHSGHVPRKAEFVPSDNPRPVKAEAVGFAAELRTGEWILFRMCKGSTEEKVTSKILETDTNANSQHAKQNTE